MAIRPQESNTAHLARGFAERLTGRLPSPPTQVHYGFFFASLSPAAKSDPPACLRERAEGAGEGVAEIGPKAPGGFDCERRALSLGHSPTREGDPYAGGHSRRRAARAALWA